MGILTKKEKRRKKKFGRKSQRSRIPDRVSIHLRPEAVNKRLVFGHWEADTVEGRNHKDGIHTEVERVSRYMMARKIAAITSAETIMVQKELFRKLPQQARKSTTMDNGKRTTFINNLRNY